MSPGSVVYHLSNLSEGGGQGKCDPLLPLYLSVKVKSYWKNNERNEKNERALPGAKTSRSNSTCIQPLS